MDLSLSPLKKLDQLFSHLTNRWYIKNDGEIDKERWAHTRIGTCNVYLDDEGMLHLDFMTKFSLKDAPPLPQELFIKD